MSFEIDVGYFRDSQPSAGVFAVRPGLHIPFNSRLLGEMALLKWPAVFVDRDGVIVRAVHYLSQPSQIELMPGVASLRLVQRGST